MQTTCSVQPVCMVSESLSVFGQAAHHWSAFNSERERETGDGEQKRSGCIRMRFKHWKALEQRGGLACSGFVSALAIVLVQRRTCRWMTGAHQCVGVSLSIVWLVWGHLNKIQVASSICKMNCLRNLTRLLRTGPWEDRLFASATFKVQTLSYIVRYTLYQQV